MKKIILFCFLITLSACDSASQILFGTKSELSRGPDLSKKMANVPPFIDFYGRAIFVITYDNKKTDYGQGLYHALHQSLSRNPNGFFLIVGFYDKDDGKVMKESLKLRQECENLGLNPQKIIIKTVPKNKSEVYESVRLYER